MLYFNKKKYKNQMRYRRTIFALSTSYGNSAISIIKISGENSIKSLMILKFQNLIQERVAILGKIYDKNYVIIDEIIVLYFSKKNSFNGEEIVELQIHGNSKIIERIFKILNSSSLFNLAKKGEFSKIAFINNKVSINQIKALLRIIQSKTKKQEEVFNKEYNGKIEKLYNIWRNIIIKILVKIELYIDFSNIVMQKKEISNINKQIKFLILKIKMHYKKIKDEEKIKKGINICITGETNVGKSTLMNNISNSETSIVSKIAGTTRDVIKNRIEICGIPITLSDLAGIRDTKNAIEQLGIIKAKNIIKSVDIVIILLDINKKNYFNILDKLKNWVNKNATMIIVGNKIDLSKNKKKDKLHFKNKINNYIFKKKFSVYGSLKKKECTHLIVKKIKEIILKVNPDIRNIFKIDKKNKNKINKSIILLEEMINTKNIEIKAEILKKVVLELGSTIGNISSKKVLSQLFKNFCIGK